MDFATWVPRIIAVIAGWGATKLTEMTGIVVDPVTLNAIGLAIYAIVHRLIDKKVNPVDAASSVLVSDGKARLGRAV